MNSDRAYQYWLHNLPGVGDRTIEKLLAEFGSAKEIYDAGKSALRRFVKEKKAEEMEAFFKSWDIDGEYEKLAQKEILFIPCDDKRYPGRLKKLAHPPYAIYCLGNMPKEHVPAAAVIGARECSEYGSYVAQAFAGRMAEAGVSIISGMARGIDGIGQRAAVEGGGRTYAVLGSGVDICYPASNRKLYEEIQEGGGGILSPFPPGTEPVKWQFRERNRIVAGLSDVLVVVEARLKSGTWITVDMALEQGKNVYAVPGRLTDRLSDGCNLLIRQGAGIALAPEDILAELAVLQNRKGLTGRKESQKETESRKVADISPVLAFLDEYPKSVDEILEDMNRKGKKVELPWLLEELINLCMKKMVRQVSGNYFAKICSDDTIIM